MAKVVDRGVTTFKHFMAYKGSLMVNDEELFASFRAAPSSARCRWSTPKTASSSRRCRSYYLAKGVTGPEGHALSRPPEVEGEATNRAIILADQAGVPLYVVHTSCIAAHEAIARARSLGKRVFGEPLIQHLVLDESEYFSKDWAHAARRVMSPPFRDKRNQDDLVERPARRLAASGGDRPLLLHHPSEGARPRRLHQDPQRHRRSRRPHAGAVDLRRRRRPADDRTNSSPSPRPTSPASSTCIRARARSCPAPTPTSSSGTRTSRRRSRPTSRSR